MFFSLVLKLSKWWNLGTVRRLGTHLDWVPFAFWTWTILAQDHPCWKSVQGMGLCRSQQQLPWRDLRCLRLLLSRKSSAHLDGSRWVFFGEVEVKVKVPQMITWFILVMNTVVAPNGSTEFRSPVRCWVRVYRGLFWYSASICRNPVGCLWDCAGWWYCLLGSASTPDAETSLNLDPLWPSCETYWIARESFTGVETNQHVDF